MKNYTFYNELLQTTIHCDTLEVTATHYECYTNNELVASFPKTYAMVRTYE